MLRTQQSYQMISRVIRTSGFSAPATFSTLASDKPLFPSPKSISPEEDLSISNGLTSPPLSPDYVTVRNGGLIFAVVAFMVGLLIILSEYRPQPWRQGACCACEASEPLALTWRTGPHPISKPRSGTLGVGFCCQSKAEWDDGGERRGL